MFQGRPRTRSAKALTELFQAVAAEWEHTGRAQTGDVAGTGRYVQAAGFDSYEKVEVMQRHYERWLSHIPSLEQRTGCDLGCWLGFSTVTQASLGCKLVYGIDPVENSAATAEEWRLTHGIENVRFRAMHEGTVPLLSASVDWVIMNQVLCNALPESFSGSLREAWRILVPGGHLMISDANNPYCPDAMERLRKNFHRAEIGDGTPAEPNGPNYRQRLQIVREAAPELADADARRIARETCYMYGPFVEEAARRFRDTGEAPGSVFEPDSLRPTCIARSGASNGNITDPFAMAAELESLGFEPPAITCTPRLERLDNEQLWQALRASQGFFIFTVKPGGA